MPGFDPRQPETYWGLFRRESRLTAARRGMAIAVSDPVRSADGISLDWSIEADGRQTRYSLLRWDDIVRDRFPRRGLRRLVSVPALFLRLWRTGYLRRFRREARRFSTIIVGIHLIYAALVVLSLAGALGLAAAMPATWRPWPFLTVPVLAYGLLALFMRGTRGKPFYVAHLVDDTAFNHDHASGAEMRMHDRLEAFAARIRAAEGGAGEVVVVGHSSSSFLAIEALDRVLAEDPEFGRRGTPVSLVTIGSVIPWIGLDPLADRVRGALDRFGRAEAIGWLDVRAEWDWLSIHLRSPLAACGLPAPAGRPAVWRVMLKDMIDSRGSRTRGYNLFQMHFQLLMASFSAQAFDYIVLVAGPEPVHATIAGIAARRNDAAGGPDSAAPPASRASEDR